MSGLREDQKSESVLNANQRGGIKKKPIKRADMLGRTFGRLVVLSDASDFTKHRQARSKCLCECGKEVVVQNSNLTGGHTRSCGCLNSEEARKRKLRHAMTGTTIYISWASMIRRCTEPNDAAYPNYGGRGITVCDRWRQSFEAFLEDMGPRRDGLEIDRIDNNKGYSPDNCRWVTTKVNCRNTRKTVRVEHDGRQIALIDLSEQLGIQNYNVMYGVFARHGRDIKKTLARLKSRGVI